MHPQPGYISHGDAVAPPVKEGGLHQRGGGGLAASPHHEGVAVLHCMFSRAPSFA